MAVDNSWEAKARSHLTAPAIHESWPSITRTSVTSLAGPIKGDSTVYEVGGGKRTR